MAVGFEDGSIMLYRGDEDNISEVANNVAKLSISDTSEKQEKIQNQHRSDNVPSSNKTLSNGLIKKSERILNQHFLNNIPSSNKTLSNVNFLLISN